MRWITELPDTQELVFTVTFIMDSATMVTTIAGHNDWDDAYVLHTANQSIKDEYSFEPYTFMYDHDIDVEVV